MIIINLFVRFDTKVRTVTCFEEGIGAIQRMPLLN